MLAIQVASPNQHIRPLTSRINESGHLTIGGCDVVELAQRFGTPLYILDEHTLRTACRQYTGALSRHYPGPSLALYASKALSLLAVSAVVAQEGMGIDVVSAGELLTALQAGVDARTVYLHGNNKSAFEIGLALDAGATVVADNWLDLETLADLAQDRPEPPRVMVRMTPGIECHTHEYIRTGHLDSKFGFDPNELPQVLAFLARTPTLHATGLHAHIGSQVFDLQAHIDTARVLVEWFNKALTLGLNFSELNIGGGLGICYTPTDDPPSIEQWVATVSRAIIDACQHYNVPLPRLLCEPGRSLIGPAGVTLYTVGSTKTVPDIRTYISVDGGMSDNPRPITYKAQYTAAVANKMNDSRRSVVTIAGKHCESGDVLLRDVELPPLAGGDVLAVFSTGAYNFSMASNYNRLTRPAIVLVSDGEASIVLKRESLDDLLRLDRLPERLQP
ncbi:MAG: diaminopimelate decarboxylase [Gemmatimonadaceae bacterium]|nr:diaminopimelate decarboxylase [Gloeobacterales cyanobacterium ES-bin-141]